MKKLTKTLLVCGALALGLGLNTNAMAETTVKPTLNVAVVNVPAVVASSSDVMALKKEQQLKIEELQKWLATVKSDIAKQQTKEGKEKLIKKYDAEFAKKQDAIRAEYASKISKIEKQITSVIEKEAKAKGYDLILSNSVVLYGGNDITKEIAKKIK